MGRALRAFIYVRVSNDDEAGNNASSAAQEEACRAHCDAQDIEVIEVFEELNVSGRALKRKQFDRMMALATSPERPVDVVVVYNLSRFARRLLTQVTAEHKLSEAGVQLLSLTEGFGDDPNGKVMRSMIAVVNEKYALDASLFTCRDRRGNARAGYWNGGPVPYGYETRVVATEGRKGRKKLFTKEEEASVIRLIFELASVGLHGQRLGTRAIAIHLNENGYTLRGRKFFHGNVDGILTRTHYTGHYLDRTKDDRGKAPAEENAIVVECPQIIEPELFTRVAALRAKAAPSVTPPRTTNSSVLLGGLAHCGHSECGAGMVIRTGKGGRYGYYVCNRKATAGAQSCGSKAIRQDALDSIVLKGLLERVLAPQRLRLLLTEVLERSDEATHRRQADLERVRRERVAEEGRQRRLLELFEEGLMSPRDPVFAERLAQSRASIAALSETERNLGNQLAGPARHIDEDAVRNFGLMLRDQITSANSELRRAYVRMLISDIVVNDNEITIIGSKAALESAVRKGETAAYAAVPSFDRKWCRLGDSNT